MPKFTESEKEEIRRSLLTKGKELFLKYGLAKTSIDDIVQACGIGKGSFYKFYSSKEELFYAIVKEEERVRDQALGSLFQAHPSSTELVRSFFETCFRMAEENPFLQHMFKEGEYERLLRKLPKHVVEESSRADDEKGRQAIEALMSSGVFREQDPELIVGILKAVLLLRLHKEKIGEELFPRVMDRLFTYVAEGLTKPTD
ncbi:TetR/AcrR family transcriptional regulator [Brevibacillus migulae]|uniref:TetR/AcrR family transcriptional regulator n=1 Tax=Brevibacillus migulae TaxID=1644114 RepID=UPI00106DEC15|nr:TetR/AcrR family transcriptional regulator [Brevibacillus migulae]